VIATHDLERVDYLSTWRAMQAFTAGRDASTPDELWLCEHPPVFTQGLAGKAVHLLAPGEIPVVATDRGGQVTFHGPGQVLAYPLLDLRRAGYFIKEYVYRLEEAVIRTLAHYGVTGHRVAGAPGIYVRLDDPFSHARLPSLQPSSGGRGRHAEAPGPPTLPLEPAGEGWGEGAEQPRPFLAPADEGQFHGLGKIAALGIKVSRHCTYHGVALNVAMDLEPFSRINPCGHVGLQTVDLSTIGVTITRDEAALVLGQKLGAQLS